MILESYHIDYDICIDLKPMKILMIAAGKLAMR